MTGYLVTSLETLTIIKGLNFSHNDKYKMIHLWLKILFSWLFLVLATYSFHIVVIWPSSLISCLSFYVECSTTDWKLMCICSFNYQYLSYILYISVIVLDDGNITDCIPLDKLNLITTNMHSSIYLGSRYWGISRNKVISNWWHWFTSFGWRREVRKTFSS